MTVWVISIPLQAIIITVPIMAKTIALLSPMKVMGIAGPLLTHWMDM